MVLEACAGGGDGVAGIVRVKAHRAGSQNVIVRVIGGIGDGSAGGRGLDVDVGELLAGGRGDVALRIADGRGGRGALLQRAALRRVENNVGKLRVRARSLGDGAGDAGSLERRAGADGLLDRAGLRRLDGQRRAAGEALAVGRDRRTDNNLVAGSFLDCLRGQRSRAAAGREGRNVGINGVFLLVIDFPSDGGVGNLAALIGKRCFEFGLSPTVKLVLPVEVETLTA